MIQRSCSGSFEKKYTKKVISTEAHEQISKKKYTHKKTLTLRINLFYHKLVICDDGVTPPCGSVVISCCCERTTAGSPANYWHLAWLMTGQHRQLGAQTRPSEWHHRREPGVKQSLWRQRQQKAKRASCRNLNLGCAIFRPPPPPPTSREGAPTAPVVSVFWAPHNTNEWIKHFDNCRK